MRPYPSHLVVAVGLAIAIALTLPACFQPASDSPTADRGPAGDNAAAGDELDRVDAGSEVLVIERDPRIVNGATDDHNEDPTYLPTNADLRPNANPASYGSPYPNPGFNSSIGMGGNIGGGGGPGGAGGFVHRRARGGAATSRAGGGHVAVSPTREALRWLRDHQTTSGYWDPATFHDAGAANGRNVGVYTNADGSSTDAGPVHARVEVTGLALQAYLAAGYTHTQGEFAQSIKMALRYLKAVQDNLGCFDTTNKEAPDFLRGHIAGTLAMVEAYAMTGSNMLKGPAQKGIDFLVSVQVSDSAGTQGWSPDGKTGGTSDLITSALAAMALHSARVAQLEVPPSAWSGINRFLDSRIPTLAGANASGLPMDQAAALMAKLMVAQDATLLANADIKSLAAHLRQHLPAAAQSDYLYWYLGTLAMFQMAGDDWKAWDKPLAELVTKAQRMTPADKASTVYGSWDSIGVRSARSRVYATTIHCLTLLTHHRYARAQQQQQPGNQDRDGLQDPADGAEADGADADAGEEGDSDQPERHVDRISVIDGVPYWNGNPMHGGRLFARDAVNAKPIGEFPLRKTDVDAEISGLVSSVRVRQSYANDFPQAVEAVYVFPLPEDAAVNEFIMIIGDRTIHGFIREKKEAQRIYNEARAAGHTAALLTQERPNIFTQHVANIPPKGQVDISIRYIAPLKYTDGEYQFTFPMVVSPRYIPDSAPVLIDADGNPTPMPVDEDASGDRAPREADPQDESDTEPISMPLTAVAEINGNERWEARDPRHPAGGGMEPDTAVVPDASRISPPVVANVHTTGHRVSLSIRMDTGVPIAEIASLNHSIMVLRRKSSRYQIKLAPGDAIANRDFVIRYRLEGKAPEFGLVTNWDESKQRGHFALMVAPPAAVDDADVIPRELVFVVDTSGSMGGAPLGQCVHFMRHAITNLRERDSYNIITFAGSSTILSNDGPLEVNDDNIARGLAFTGNMRSGGGTNVMSALDQLARAPREKGRMRVVVFLTDGHVGNESQILGSIQLAQEDGRSLTRYFALGVGSSPNRHLISGIARHGNGRSYDISLNESPEAVVDRCYQSIDAPVLWDFRLDWGDIEVDMLHPSTLGDLWAGQPIVLYGRYSTPAAGTLRIQARRGLDDIEIEVPIQLPGADHPGASRNSGVAAIWARHHIQEINDRLRTVTAEDKRTELQDEVRDIALEYSLMSPYTSFVAVDRSRVVSDGKPLRVLQPIEATDGQDQESRYAAMQSARLPQFGINVRQLPDGSLWIDHVDKDSAAATAGLRPGVRLWSLNGTQIQTLRHLDSLLQQRAQSTTDAPTFETRDGDTIEEHTLDQ